MMVYYIYELVSTILKNGRLWWENSKISQNVMALIAIAPKQGGEILEISHLAIHETQF